MVLMCSGETVKTICLERPKRMTILRLEDGYTESWIDSNTWFLLEDNEFDMIQSTQNADAYYVTVLTSTYNEAQQNLEIATAWADGHVTLYE